MKALERAPMDTDEQLKQRYQETIDMGRKNGFARMLDEKEFENTKSDLQ